MNHLIIYCHPNPTSFNRAIADSVEALSHALGHDTATRDLYGMGFNPVLSKTDLGTFPDNPTPEIVQEQEFITWADLLTLVYPVWWTGMPAMLKGYIDRVFSEHFAYTLSGDRMTGLLQGKKVLIFNTTGLASTFYTKHGMHKAMSITTGAGIFELCGMEVLHHAFFGSVATVTEEVRKSYLAEVVAIASRYL